MLAGNDDHFSIFLRFLGLLVGVVGLVEVVHGFRVARVNFPQFTGFGRFPKQWRIR